MESVNEHGRFCGRDTFQNTGKEVTKESTTRIVVHKRGKRLGQIAERCVGVSELSHSRSV
jgi:hypothetical protein